jgi:hypothetical protein
MDEQGKPLWLCTECNQTFPPASFRRVRKASRS